VKIIAATPVAPRTLGIAMWPAPLFLELAPVPVALALALTTDPEDVTEAVVRGFEAPEAAAAGVAAADPDEGLAEPLISAWTVELN